MLKPYNPCAQATHVPHSQVPLGICAPQLCLAQFPLRNRDTHAVRAPQASLARGLHPTIGTHKRFVPRNYVARKVHASQQGLAGNLSHAVHAIHPPKLCHAWDSHPAAIPRMQFTPRSCVSHTVRTQLTCRSQQPCPTRRSYPVAMLLKGLATRSRIP